MRYLIVAADDFGFSESINKGIVKAHKEGIVTSLNLMPTGEAFHDALNLAKDIGLKEVGAHLSLTETAPVTEPGSVPSLVTKDGLFYKNYSQFFLNLCLGKIDQAHIYLELKNQLERLKKTGLKIININSHEHIHIMPGMLEVFLRLAKEYGIPSIRYPHKDKFIGPPTFKKIYKKLILGCLEGHMGLAIKKASMKYPDNFIGFLDSGNLREDKLIAILNSLDEGVTELVCHPGFLSPELLDRCIFHLKCEGELSALTSPYVKEAILRQDIKLIKYGEFLYK